MLLATSVPRDGPQRQWMPSRGGLSCTGHRQACSYSRAKEPFLGQPEGALVPEVLLRDFFLCAEVKAMFLMACLAPTTSQPLLNTEACEAGGDSEKPGPPEKRSI